MENIAKTVGFKEGERNVFFHILTACNLSCKHCYINKDQHGSVQLTKKEMVDWMELFALKDKKDKKSNLIFLGGEPTMHPDLAYGIEKAKDLGFAVTVDSNGFLFNNILEKSNPKLLDYLSFSLDGPDAEVNDPIRGNGVFDVCTGNIKKAVSMGYNVSLIYTVSRKNLKHLERMVPLLKELKIQKFFIQVIGLRGNSASASTDETSQVTWQEWLDVVPEVAKSAAKEGIHVTYPKVFLDKDEHFQCAGNVAENYFVFPNGRVYQCPLCEDHPIHSYQIENGKLNRKDGLRENNFFKLNISEGCVMNKLLQPDTIEYDEEGNPLFKISCCLLKQEIGPE